MTETLHSNEQVKNIEQYKQELELALVAVETAAAAVGKFEVGRPEADFGMAENLYEAETAARKVFEMLLRAVKAQGEAEGVKNQTETLDFRVG